MDKCPNIFMCFLHCLFSDAHSEFVQTSLLKEGKKKRGKIFYLIVRKACTIGKYKWPSSLSFINETE